MVKLILLSLCFLIAYSNSHKIKQCKQCVLSNGQIIKVGETKPEEGTCNIVTCHEDLSLSALTCAEFVVLPPCIRVEGDPTKLYPDCCDSAKCPEDQK